MNRQQTLNHLMQAQLVPGGVAIADARDLHMEVIDTQTGLVWMSFEAVTQQDFNRLELDDGLRPVGIMAPAMDATLFQYSPGARGEPMRERVIGGHRFINVAFPGQPKKLPCGLTEVMVNKAHVLGYNAERTVRILNLAEGDFVEVVGDGDNDDQLSLPEGASFKKITLKEPWVVVLPTPTKTLWDFGEPLRSFQGPVRLPLATDG